MHLFEFTKLFLDGRRRETKHGVHVDEFDLLGKVPRVRRIVQLFQKHHSFAANDTDSNVILIIAASLVAAMTMGSFAMYPTVWGNSADVTR